MTAGAFRRLASQNGVAPTMLGSKKKSTLSRRVGVGRKRRVGIRSSGERRRSPFVPMQQGGVERGVAGARLVGIRAFREQKRGDAAVSAVRGHDQDAGAVRRRLIDIGAGGHEQLRRFEVADTCREQQRRVAALLNVHDVGRIGGLERRLHHSLSTFVLARTSAPAASSRATTSGCRCPTAHISAV